MQTKFMIGGNTVDVVKMNEETMLSNLPPRVYTIQFDRFRGFYLEITKDELELPAKIYGNSTKRVEKCIQTYKDRSASTGILMTGDKGTGKSLFMSLLANQAIENLGLPVLLVKEPYAGEQFTSFIETIGECCIVFDEFGKMYSSLNRIGENEVSQKELLTMMDGVDKTKRLIIMTENSENDINEFMLNRPSRVFYHFRYKKLDEISIKDYCVDKGVDENTQNDLIELSRNSRIFSFDMLQSIVEEHLRFGDTVEEAIVDLNVNIKRDESTMVKIVKVIEKDTQLERKLFGDSTVSASDGYFYVKIVPTEPREEDHTHDNFYVDDGDLAYEKDGHLIYEKDGLLIVTKSIESRPTNFWELV